MHADDQDEPADARGWLRTLDPSIASVIAPDGRPPYPWSESGLLARPLPSQEPVP